MAVQAKNFKSLTDTEIKAFEERNKLKIPQNFIGFLHRYNGSTPETNSFEKTYSVNNFIELSKFKEELPNELNIKDFLPFAEDGCGNYFLLRLHDGAIIFWDHEIEEPDSLQKIANNITEFDKKLIRDEENINDIISKNDVTFKKKWIDPDFEREMIEKGLMNKK
ncbi:SMI1/KNR4 family protein [Piscirickettsia litoralis]|uniref:Knr4/Smi1-like domain-containing protein n=1 Tax=Piscirickettsia litoralis TaxID=1891921 RepID=A0ABX2ZY46_9GAMM|nr:SMI1/KNR4 family protein [Piscirickettsia litoralis]ODN41413.1 hypothetical protein BGC07_16755 [Piscirickettsia litoralis]